ncbi:MAG TPA: hypothetical protein VM008_09230 [Phycisphaerae bacterium]|nr:hypothetical protein [Phycisphaerae bacterium]
MAELSVPPLLAHAPEVSPPWRWRLLLLPAVMGVVGILIATACAISGQDTRRDFNTIEMQNDYAHAEAALAQAELRHAAPEEIEKLESELKKQQERKLPRYAEYGRQFTQWDAYRYEEIIEKGYLYHQPTDPEVLKEAATLIPPGEGGETKPRLKNVVWYPLYPILGWGVSQVLRIAPVAGLTVVSQVCAVLSAVVLFLYARRHYYNRMPRLPAWEEDPMRKWDLSPQDTAAMWACAALLYGPCSIFLYANFTESLFVLLLCAFLYCLQGRWWWRAALVAAVASACRAQGVLFAPILGLTFLLRSDIRNPMKRFGVGTVLGMVSLIGIVSYAAFLGVRFGDPLAFNHAQQHWNVGLHTAQFYNALNPMNALTHVMKYAFYTGPMDWPRLWEALCIIWPPIMLLVLGGRFLSFELEVVGWLLWGVPYVSNGLAGSPPLSSQWMSMGRFMAVLIPAHIIIGAVFGRMRWAGIPWLAIWGSAFGVFAVKFGAGNWIG